MFGNAGTYHYAVVARNFVKVSQVGLTLVVENTLLIAVVDCEVVAINVVANKDIGYEIQE